MDPRRGRFQGVRQPAVRQRGSSEVLPTRQDRVLPAAAEPVRLQASLAGRGHGSLLPQHVRQRTPRPRPQDPVSRLAEVGNTHDGS